MNLYGHHFTPYGNEEILCRACGFVSWPNISKQDLYGQLTEHLGNRLYCGGEHHRFLTEEEWAQKELQQLKRKRQCR